MDVSGRHERKWTACKTQSNSPQLFSKTVFVVLGSPASLLIEEEAMKRTILGIALAGLMGAGSLMAQDRDDWRPNRDVRHDYADRRGDYRDIRNDQAKIAHDRWELNRDLRNGNYAGAREERQELRGEYRDVNRDRRDVRRDTRDVRNDRFWGWR
jgi:hypothetical protein